MTPVAALLNDAINFLRPGVVTPTDVLKKRFSCDAVYAAYTKRHSVNAYTRAREFLAELGCDLASCTQFLHLEEDNSHFCYAKPSTESQQARALWLTWAAMIAEEEGL